tara:strand:+ start:1599 stop:2342 length:744 start_codon:yes stop_codon:yes gene_type:complete
MSWLLLFSIIYGGTQSPFTDVYFEKHINTYILDEERKKDILAIYNSTRVDAALYKINEQKRIDELEYQFEQKRTSSDDLTHSFFLIGERRDDLKEKMINVRLKMQEYIKADEWALILPEIEKDLRMSETNLDYTQARLEMRFNTIGGIIRQEIRAENSREKVLDAFSTHEFLVMDLAKDIRKHRLYDNLTLRSINATRAKLEVVMEERNQYCVDLYKTYIELHQVLAENTTQKEWDSIIHEVKINFK